MLSQSTTATNKSNLNRATYKLRLRLLEDEKEHSSSKKPKSNKKPRL